MTRSSAPKNLRDAIKKSQPQKMTIREALAQQQPGQAKVIKG